MLNEILYQRLEAVLDMLNANYRAVIKSPSAVKVYLEVISLIII